MVLLCWCQIPSYFLVLWPCRDPYLCLDNNTEVLRDEVARYLQLTFRWFRKHQICMYLPTCIWEETQSKNSKMFLIDKFRWDTILSTLLLNLQLFIKKAGVGEEKRQQLAELRLHWWVMENRNARGHMDEALGLTRPPLTGRASSERWNSPEGALLVWNGSRCFNCHTQRESSVLWCLQA